MVAREVAASVATSAGLRAQGGGGDGCSGGNNGGGKGSSTMGGDGGVSWLVLTGMSANGGNGGLRGGDGGEGGDRGDGDCGGGGETVQMPHVNGQRASTSSCFHSGVLDGLQWVCSRSQGVGSPIWYRPVWSGRASRQLLHVPHACGQLAL